MSEYKKMAEDFLKKHNAKMTFERIGKIRDPLGSGSNNVHNQYEVTIRRNGKHFTFTFTDSAWNTEKGIAPSEYDVLACLGKYEPDEDILDFANEFGYEIHCKEDFNRVKRIHSGCKREYNGMVRLFGDCMEELREIQ